MIGLEDLRLFRHLDVLPLDVFRPSGSLMAGPR